MMKATVDFTGSKILLFTPQGKGIYGTALYDKLVEKGATVKIYNERVSTSTVSKVIYRVGKDFVRFHFREYLHKIIKENKDADFDYILIIRGEAFDKKEVLMLKKAFPNTKLILYLWDSLKNNNKKSLFPYFDKALSFDLEDCEKEKSLIFRPLFFTDHFRRIQNIEKKTIDVLFVGTVRSDRFSLIRQTEQYLEKTNLSSYFYLYFPSRILFFKKKLTDPDFKRVSINDFNFNLISLNRISSLMEKSFSSLDMKPPNQSGLTMRTIEVLGAQRKLITTNEQVQKYDFFDEQNITVLKKDFNEIDFDFFNTPFKEIPKDIYEKYYLERWLDDVFR